MFVVVVGGRGLSHLESPQLDLAGEHLVLGLLHAGLHVGLLHLHVHQCGLELGKAGFKRLHW